jgi:hypothetical protein
MRRGSQSRSRQEFSSPLKDCVAIHELPTLVISSGARDLAFLATDKEKISRLRVEMTIATQSLRVRVSLRGFTPILAFYRRGDRYNTRNIGRLAAVVSNSAEFFRSHVEHRFLWS